MNSTILLVLIIALTATAAPQNSYMTPPTKVNNSYNVPAYNAPIPTPEIKSTPEVKGTDDKVPSYGAPIPTVLSTPEVKGTDDKVPSYGAPIPTVEVKSSPLPTNVYKAPIVTPAALPTDSVQATIETPVTRTRLSTAEISSSATTKCSTTSTEETKSVQATIESTVLSTSTTTECSITVQSTPLPTNVYEAPVITPAALPTEETKSVQSTICSTSTSTTSECSTTTTDLPRSVQATIDSTSAVPTSTSSSCATATPTDGFRSVQGTTDSSTVKTYGTATVSPTSPTNNADYAPFGNGDKPTDKDSVPCKVTFKDVSRECMIPKELATGSVPRCGDTDGLNVSPTSDLTARFCAAIRAQISKIPGLEEASKGGSLDAQLIATKEGLNGLFNASNKSTNVNSLLTVVLGLASTVFALLV